MEQQQPGGWMSAHPWLSKGYLGGSLSALRGYYRGCGVGLKLGACQEIREVLVGGATNLV